MGGFIVQLEYLVGRDMKLLAKIAFVVIFFSFAGNASAGRASAKLSSLADSLIKVGIGDVHDFMTIYPQHSSAC